MNQKQILLRRIWELDFALHELTLYLDTHPDCARAAELVKKYREKREDAVGVFEAKYGKYYVTSNETPVGGKWKWLDGPWPWENKFSEE